MKSFSNYLDKIKADDLLKESTTQYVLATLHDAQKARAEEDIVLKKRKARRKRMTIAFSSLVACAFIAIGGSRFYNTPLHYINIDINPSVEFGVNILNKVVYKEAYNEDGASVLNANLYKSKSLENVMTVFIQEVITQGYIADDGTTAIVITVESDNEKTAIELQNICSTEIDLTLKSMDASANVYTDWVSLELRKQAREAGLSPGKYQSMQSNNPQTNVGEDIETKTPDSTAEQRQKTQSETPSVPEEQNQNSKEPEHPTEQGQNQKPEEVNPETEQEPGENQPQEETNNDYQNQGSSPNKGTTEKR
jgi:hypothetical protein